MQKTLLFGIACLGIVALVFIDRWQVTHWRAKKEIELHAMAELCQTRLENVIASRLNAVQALSSLFVLHPETKSEEFTHFAAMLLKFNPPIRALQYADSKTRVTYVHPLERNEITITKPIILLTDPERGPFVEKAISQKTASVQGPFELRQGGTGLIVRAPIFLGESFIGLAIGVYDVPVLIQEALTVINLNQFAYRLVDSEGRLFSGSDNISEDFQEKFILVADSQWTFSLSWTGDTVHPPVLTRALIIVCGAGFSISSLLLIYFLQAQTKRLQLIVEERTQDISKSNKSLIDEIFERKKTEKSLRESETHLRTLINTIPDLVWLKDPNGIYLSCNSKFEQFFGAKEYDIVGKTDYDFVDKDLADFFRENDRKAKELGQASKNEEWLTFSDDGYYGLFETIKTPMRNPDGKLIGVLGIARDITDRKKAEQEKKKLEQELRHAQKMESIGTLTGGVAHDFNNILGIIVGNTELALDDVPEWNPAYSSLKEIKTASLRATSIVKQLLSFSRKTDQKLQPIEVAIVIKDALKFLRSTIPSTIDIHQEIQTTDETILADPTQINQIMMNLCINASHAMEQTGGKLTITVENVTLDDSSATDYPDLKSGNHVKIMVGDTGPGIDPEIIDRIFDPYFTTKGVGKGSGMGLAMVHGIVKSHSGSITVDSALGKGTKFSILFPLAQGKVAVEAETIQEIPRGTETILFVDDEIFIVKMVQRMFERLGYKVETATTPQDALDRFTLNPDHFDLVITDMTMPQMTGVKLSEKLTEIRPDIPIIICTGHSALVDKERAKELGLAAYVMKPINMQETAQTIRKILDKK